MHVKNTVFQGTSVVLSVLIQVHGLYPELNTFVLLLLLLIPLKLELISSTLAESLTLARWRDTSSWEPEAFKMAMWRWLWWKPKKLLSVGLNLLTNEGGEVISWEWRGGLGLGAWGKHRKFEAAAVGNVIGSQQARNEWIVEQPEGPA